MLHDLEYQSLEAFVSFLRDDERSTFSVEDLSCLNFHTHIGIPALRKCLESMGFSLAKREKPRKVRGFATSSHDRWFGPGSQSP